MREKKPPRKSEPLHTSITKSVPQLDNMMLHQAFIDAMADEIGKAIAQAKSAWAKEREIIAAETRATISDLNAKIAEALAKVKDGKDGAPGEKGEAGPEGPQGERGDQGVQGPRGEKGTDGKDADESAIEERLFARIMEQRAEFKGDPGEDGSDGKSGRDGLDGKDGADGIDGKDGADGLNGKDGSDGLDGKDGADGADGKDGRGIQRTFINKGGQLVVIYTDGSSDELDCVVGRDGEPGRDGTDGRNADDVVIERVVERLVNMSDQWRGKDGTSIEYVGVYTQSEEYKKGDAVTFGGSLWIATEPTSEKPGTGKAWKLAVKKGRDGK